MQLNAIRNLTVRGQSQGLDKLETDLLRVGSAQDKVAKSSEGLSKTTDTTSRRQLSVAGSYERLIERTDRMVYLQRQLEREQAIVNRAFETGHITMERQAQSLALVEARFSRLIAAETAARQATQINTLAIDEQANALHRLAVANDNASARSNPQFSTANIAAQMFDVGVTAPFMPAWQVGLQQGAQLSQAFAGQTLRSSIMGVGAAAAALISPVSLVTVGLTTLSAVGIQAFMNMNKGAEDTAKGLERHQQRLHEILRDYDEIRSAADAAQESAARAPEGMVRTDLAFQLIEIEKSRVAVERSLEANRRDIEEQIAYFTQISESAAMVGSDASAVQAGMQQVEMLRQLAIDAAASDEALAGAAEAANRLHREAEDHGLRDMAGQLLVVVKQLMDVRAEAYSAEAALAALNNMDIQVRIEAQTDQAVAAIERMANAAPDLLSVRERLDVDLSTALGSEDNLLRMAAREQHANTLAALDEMDRRREAERSNSASSPFDQWDNSVETFQQRIAQSQLEVQLLGQSTFEIERQRSAFELLNQAKQAGIPVTETLQSQISTMAQDYAMASVELERLTERQQMIDQVNNTLASSFSNLFMGILDGSQSAEEGVASLLRSLTAMAMNSAWQQIFSGSQNGGGIGGLVAGLFQPTPNALGGVYASQSLSAFSNQIHDTPKLFQFAKGIGQFAEAGPEAIMPLGRDGQGRLGVRTMGGGGGSDRINVSVVNNGQPVQAEATSTRNADGSLDIQVTLKPMVRGAVREDFLGGGMDNVMEQLYGLRRVGR